MNTEWAIEVLERWIDLAKQAKKIGSGGTQLTRHSPVIDKLIDVEDQTARVVARVMGLQKVPRLIGLHQIYFLLDVGIKDVSYALGRVRSDAETRKQLGSSAPSISADLLHPIVWSAASALWDDGHFGPAVQRAATMVNAHVQDRLGRHDLSDSPLMQQAFSMTEPSEGQPRLRWPGEDSDLTVKSMRDGLVRLAPGVFMTIRNPSTHSIDQLPRQEALEQLAVLSQLARWIDACEVLLC
ncbi:MAG: hypothetical protein JWQ12_659 [Glaciihabitans sp.]|nr:hypothetical protein [Glaciihabitans sp.]